MKEGLSVMLISPEDIKNYRKIVHTLNRGKSETVQEGLILGRVSPFLAHLSWNHVDVEFNLGVSSSGP